MHIDEGNMVLQQMNLAMQVIDKLELEEILNGIEHADALGPILDPTAYRDMLYRDGNMHDIAHIIRLIIIARDEWRKIMIKAGLEQLYGNSLDNH